MKLWCQSCTDMGNNPIWNDYEACLEKHFRRVARAGTEISLHGTRVFSGRTRLYQYDVYLHTSQIIEGAIQAEREGFDAFVQIGMQDYGFLEVREAVGIPVIASGGVSSVKDITALRGASVEGVIIGKALYSGGLSLKDALDAAAGSAQGRV